MDTQDASSKATARKAAKKKLKTATESLPEIKGLERILDGLKSKGLPLLSTRSVAPDDIANVVLPAGIDYVMDGGSTYGISCGGFLLDGRKERDLRLRCYAKARGAKSIYQGSDGSFLIRPGRVQAKHYYGESKNFAVNSSKPADALIAALSATMIAIGGNKLSLENVSNLITSLTVAAKLPEDALTTALELIQTDNTATDLTDKVGSITAYLMTRKKSTGKISSFLTDVVALYSSATSLSDINEHIVSNNLDAASAARLLSGHPDCRLPLYKRKKGYLDKDGAVLQGVAISSLEDGQVVPCGTRRIIQSQLSQLLPATLVIDKVPYMALRAKGKIKRGGLLSGVGEMPADVFKTMARLNAIDATEGKGSTSTKKKSHQLANIPSTEEEDEDSSDSDSDSSSSGSDSSGSEGEERAVPASTAGKKGRATPLKQEVPARKKVKTKN